MVTGVVVAVVVAAVDCVGLAALVLVLVLVFVAAVVVVVFVVVVVEVFVVPGNQTLFKGGIIGLLSFCAEALFVTALPLLLLLGFRLFPMLEIFPPDSDVFLGKMVG